MAFWIINRVRQLFRGGLPLKVVYDVTETEVSEEGAVPVVHGTQADGAVGRGEHQHFVPMSSQPLLSDTSHGPRHSAREELRGGEHPHLLGILLPQVTQLPFTAYSGLTRVRNEEQMRIYTYHNRFLPVFDHVF